MDFWSMILYGYFLGWAGMNIGGILAYVLGKADPVILHLFVYMTTGALYSIVFTQVLPESLLLGGLGMTLLGFLIGSFFAMWLQSSSHHLHTYLPIGKQKAFLKSGLLLAVAIGLHNFPSGIALSSALIQSPALAHGLSIALMLHNVPEGVALGLPLVLSQIGFPAFLLLSTLVALPIGIGSFAGLFFGEASPGLISLFLGFSIGTILYITFAEIFLPLWKEEKRKEVGLFTFLAGGAFAYLFFAFLHQFASFH